MIVVNVAYSVHHLYMLIEPGSHMEKCIYVRRRFLMDVRQSRKFPTIGDFFFFEL